MLTGGRADIDPEEKYPFGNPLIIFQFQFNLLFLVFPNGWLGHNGCSGSTYLLIKKGRDTFVAIFEYLKLAVIIFFMMQLILILGRSPRYIVTIE